MKPKLALTTFVSFLLLCGLAATAGAAPDIGPVESKLKKGKKLTLKFEVTMGAPGEVRLEGDVNGVPVNLTKRVKKAATKRIRLKVNAGKLGFKGRDTSLDFNLTIRAVEESGAEDTKDASQIIALPLIYLHGLGGDLSGEGISVFETALELVLPDTYDSEGEKPNLLLFTYDSTGTPLGKLGAQLEAEVKRALKATGFRKVDLVGHSMGGLVCRSYLTRRGAGAKVRKCVFLATPNEGTPLAYLAGILSGFVTVDALPEEFRDIAGTLLTADVDQVLSSFYPSYDWLEVPGLFAGQLPATDSPLTDLNGIAPAAGVEFHAFAYSSTGQEAGDLFGITVGTVERIELDLADGIALLALLADPTGFDLENLPLDMFVLGDGDGLVPYRSAVMSDVPAWSAAMAAHDLGIGIHGAMPADPRVALKLAEILTD